jgi:hypothetical protein
MRTSSVLTTDDVNLDDDDSLFGESPPVSPKLPLTPADRNVADTLARFQSAEQQQFGQANTVAKNSVSILGQQGNARSISAMMSSLLPENQTYQQSSAHVSTPVVSRSLAGTNPRQLSEAILPAQQSLRQWPGRVPFQDVRAARAWLLDEKVGQAQAAIKRDATIPRGLLQDQQKREAANKLRVAFEGAQPVKSDLEFHKLDARCLELVQDIIMFHLFGPLTPKYTTGQAKVGPVTFDTFDEHVATIAQVLGTHGPKAKSVRKHLTGVPYHKRLIDNPLEEIALVEKNKGVNDARKLKLQQTKAEAAKAVELEREVAQLKSQMTIRPRAKRSLATVESEDNDSETNAWAQPPPAGRKTNQPRRPSSQLTGGYAKFKMQDGLHIYPKSPFITPGDLLQGVGGVFNSTSSESEVASPYQWTIPDTQGPSAAKRPRFGDITDMAIPSIPARRHNSTAVFGYQQQGQATRGYTGSVQEEYRREDFVPANLMKPRPPRSMTDGANGYENHQTIQHQRQQGRMLHQTEQITELRYQQNVTSLDCVDEVAAEGCVASPRYALLAEPLFPVISASELALGDISDIPDLGMMTDEELAELFNVPVNGFKPKL